MFKLSLLLILFSSTSLWAKANYRGGAELLNPKAYSINSSAEVFQTTGYYDYDSSKVALPDTSKYRLIDVNLSLSYGISKNFEVTGMGRFRSISSTLNDVTTNKSGPESLGVEAKYALPPVGSARYAIGIHYRQTLYSTATYDSSVQLPADEVILGDSGSEYGVDLYFNYLMKALKWDAKVGYSSPANNLSDEVNYKIEGIYRFDQLSFLGGIEGIYSLKKDEFSDTPLLKPVQANGATSLFNSINREKVAPYIGATYAFDKVLVGIKGQTVLSGTSTDKGNSIMLSLGWSSSGETAEEVKVESFKEYEVDGSVLKVSARGNFVRIDQGLSTDVEKGMKFDIYQTDYFGGNILVASGVAYEVGTDWSIIKIVKKYKEIEIKPGFAARGY